MADSKSLRVVLDTSVLVAAARSRHGASFALVSSIPAAEFVPCLSVGLYAEWQDVLTRRENLPPGRTPEDALAFVRYVASQSHLQEIRYWVKLNFRFFARPLAALGPWSILEACKRSLPARHET